MGFDWIYGSSVHSSRNKEGMWSSIEGLYNIVLLNNILWVCKDFKKVTGLGILLIEGFGFGHGLGFGLF